MKKLVLFALFQTFVILKVYSQDRADIYTPKGDNVEAYRITSEWSENYRGYYDNYYSQAYPNATLILTYGGYSTTKKFNCHAYAWHISEGGEYRWIGFYRDSDEDIYWTGGSYTEVSPVYPGGKVSYGSYDHSATIADPLIYGSGWFVSKWGNKVLMRHQYDDCPYTSTNLKYYKLNPNMTGSTNLLCYNVQRTFSTNITHMSAATLTWTKGSHISYVSGAGTPQYTVKGSGIGDSYVNFQITTPSGFSWSSSKEFHVGPYSSSDYPISGPGSASCNQYVYYSIPQLEEVTSINWTWPPGWTYVSGQGTRYLALRTGQYGGMVGVGVDNTCGQSGSYDTHYTAVYGCYGPFGYTIFPNPATSELVIELKDLKPGEVVSHNELSIDQVLILNEKLEIVAMKILKGSDNKRVIIDVTNIEAGTVYLKVNVGVYEFTERVVIDR